MALTTGSEEYYSQLLDIILDELNVKQVRLVNGVDENGKVVALVYDGSWYWLHGEEKKEVKNRDIIKKACTETFKKK